MKKQPMSHRLQQRYQSMQGWKRGAHRGSHGSPKTPRCALQSQGLHQTLTFGMCTEVRTTQHHWPWKSTHPDPNEKAFSGLGIWLGTSSLWSPALPTSKMHNAAGLTGDPRRVAWPKGFHTHENHQLKPLSAWQCSSTSKKNSLQNKLQPTVREKKNPPANHQSQHSAWCFTPTLTSVLSPTGKHVWSSYLASRWRRVSARFLSTELG